MNRWLILIIFCSCIAATACGTSLVVWNTIQGSADVQYISADGDWENHLTFRVTETTREELAQWRADCEGHFGFVAGVVFCSRVETVVIDDITIRFQEPKKQLPICGSGAFNLQTMEEQTVPFCSWGPSYFSFQIKGIDYMIMPFDSVAPSVAGLQEMIVRSECQWANIALWKDRDLLCTNTSFMFGWIGNRDTMVMVYP